jgi:chorismate synthase
MSNTLGKLFRVTCFGESHGLCVGAVVDGCPAGLKLKPCDIQEELDKRRPGQSNLTTSRIEEDKVEIISGIFNDITTGAPICMLIWNKDRDSTHYEQMRVTPRPGHADYTAYIKYGGFNDYRGGGRFSGRITASFVMAGALAKKILKETLNITVLAHTKEIGGIKAAEMSPEEIAANKERNPVRSGDLEASESMVSAIMETAKQGDSLGGVIECFALNLPPGLGEPIFDNLEGEIAKALYSIPAVKAVEFGHGRRFSELKGSESNDPFTIKEGKIATETNRAGGVLGGISNGMPIKIEVTIKPTPSISKKQKTIDISNMEESNLEIKGRHDPCIVPRAVPVVENILAFTLLDHTILAGLIPKVIRG